MIDERFEEPGSDQKLVRLVRKFSVLEGRQPRAMVCRSQGYETEEKIKEVSVDLAGFGFDVDIGVPFDSILTLGMNAIENDVDLLILFGLDGNSGKDFVAGLKMFFSEKGYPDLLILRQALDFSSDDFKESLTDWLGQTLQ